MNRHSEALAHVLTSDDYRCEFYQWIACSWDVYLEFERLALAAQKRGRHRLSAKFIGELIRWNSAASEEDSPYKLNNTHSSCMARLCVHLNPVLSGLFEFRARSAV